MFLAVPSFVFAVVQEDALGAVASLISTGVVFVRDIAAFTSSSALMVTAPAIILCRNGVSETLVEGTSSTFAVLEVTLCPVLLSIWTGRHCGH